MAVSLGLTLIIEIVFALFWRLQSPRELLLVGAVNLLTNCGGRILSGPLAGFERFSGGAGDGNGLDIKGSEASVGSCRHRYGGILLPHGQPGYPKSLVVFLAGQQPFLFHRKPDC